MTFEELWHQGVCPSLFGVKESARMAWNEAISEAARIVESRGARIGGAIQPDRIARDIRALSSNAELRREAMKAKKKRSPNRVASDDGLERIFSGDYSGAMWDEINSARTVRDLRNALYFVCCRLQELEHRIEKMRANTEVSREP